MYLNKRLMRMEELKNLEGLNLIRLIYRFKEALNKEEYELCERIKKECERRRTEGKFDSNLVEAIISFYNTYSNENGDKNRENFNELFSKYYQ